MKAYKLVRKMKDGFAPLFINPRMRMSLNKWLESEFHPTKGYAKRQGWHACFKPYAPHLVIGGEGKGKNRVWVEIELENCKTYNRPECQGGSWVLGDKMKIIRELTFEEVEEILKKEMKV